LLCVLLLLDEVFVLEEESEEVVEEDEDEEDEVPEEEADDDEEDEELDFRGSSLFAGGDLRAGGLDVEDPEDGDVEAGGLEAEDGRKRFGSRGLGGKRFQNTGLEISGLLPVLVG